MHGRIKGQLAVVALLGASLWLAGCGTTRDEVTLSGAAEVPPVNTSATGSATAELEGDTLQVSGSFTGLGSELFVVPNTGSSAHVHRAPAGENGPVLFPLEVVPGADGRSGTFRGSKVLTEEERGAFRDGNLYVNIHTANNPSGEIRGQFAP